MNFTREPIIETIISPRDGFKLLVRNSKGGETEEYTVDALEVVSFGQAFFLRSLEKPKSFLLPVSDYEVVEVKETRVALKNISHDRTIKIGGGKEASIRGNHPPQEKEVEPLPSSPEEEAEETEQAATAASPDQGRASENRRRDRHRRRRRRGGEEQWAKPQEGAPKTGGEASTGEEAPKPVFAGLIPPPSTLVSGTISRYKDLIDDANEKKKEAAAKPPVEEPPAGTGESTTLQRVSAVESTLVSSHILPSAPGLDIFF